MDGTHQIPGQARRQGEIPDNEFPFPVRRGQTADLPASHGPPRPMTVRAHAVDTNMLLSTGISGPSGERVRDAEGFEMQIAEGLEGRGGVEEVEEVEGLDWQVLGDDAMCPCSMWCCCEPGVPAAKANGAPSKHLDDSPIGAV